MPDHTSIGYKLALILEIKPIFVILLHQARRKFNQSLTGKPRCRIDWSNECYRRLFLVPCGSHAPLARVDRDDQAPGAARDTTPNPDEYTRRPLSPF